MEGIGQELTDTLRAGGAYYFSIDIAATPYSEPCYVRIFLGDSLCDKEQLIFTSPLPDTVWERHVVSFVPNQDYSYVRINSYTTPNILSGYVFVDNLSAIDTGIYTGVQGVGVLGTVADEVVVRLYP